MQVLKGKLPRKPVSNVAALLLVRVRAVRPTARAEPIASAEREAVSARDVPEKRAVSQVVRLRVANGCARAVTNVSAAPIVRAPRATV